jgi:NAD(P)-dependent dehydrogenase (short-subunit alcohol dehydrogenase family)
MIKNILITGADKGLGFSLTKLYLEKGYTVFSGLLNSPSEAFLKLKSEYGEKLSIVSLDVSSDASVASSLGEVSRLTDKLDVLINNAGVHFEKSFAVLEEVDFQVALDTHNINTLGPLRVAKAYIPLVRRGQEKVIVNISSEAGSIGECWRDKEFDYCMSKTALNMQSVLLQKYLKSDGIKILAVHPGWMQTDMGGAEADISSDTSALGIYELVNKYKGELDSPIYMDYSGRLFNW